MNRRDFLQISSLMPLMGISPAAFANSRQDFSGKIVLLVELKGGNDGLSSLIPYRDSNYYRLRPSLAVRNAIPLNQKLGINPYLKALMPLWHEGDMAWIQGVGYQNPSRSHFHSMDIWETASTRNNETQGWINRVLHKSHNQLNGIVLGDNNLGPMGGENSAAVAMEDPTTFLRQTKYLNKQPYRPHNRSLAHLLDVQNQINSASVQINEVFKRKRSLVRFPTSRFGRKLELVTQMITNGMNTPVYKVALEGFDTHANQTDKHNNLMNHLGGGLLAFSKAMKKAKLWDNVLVVTYSEFGRRAAENYSGGTDHGSAAAHFALGGRVNGGIFGAYPSLSELHRGDLKHTVDFREIYATLAQRWWGKPNPWKNHHKPIPFV